jgi:hypothetical protein
MLSTRTIIKAGKTYGNIVRHTTVETPMNEYKLISNGGQMVDPRVSN